MVSSFVKRPFDNDILPRGWEKRMSNGGVDNGTQWIGDDNTASNKDSRRYLACPSSAVWFEISKSNPAPFRS